MLEEAWLQFEINDEPLIQTATFWLRRLGGRTYWQAVLPLHWILFARMAKKLTSEE